MFAQLAQILGAPAQPERAEQALARRLRVRRGARRR
jgi:hypothetical protein